MGAGVPAGLQNRFDVFGRWLCSIRRRSRQPLILQRFLKYCIDVTPERAAQVFKVLGDPTRVRIVRYLACCDAPIAIDERGSLARADGATVGEVCCHLTGISAASARVSFHLKELRTAGLIETRRHGKHIVCRLAPEARPLVLEALELCLPTPGDPMEPKQQLIDVVREKYGEAALSVLKQARKPCCGGDSEDPITSNLYGSSETDELPESAVLASLGCGNPTALAQLAEGEIVLDLGSGGGIDVLLSARRVGPTGFAYGLDMTDEMLELAERNRQQAGAENVKFLKGQIEQIPLPDASVDVIISNCVINLSADKDKVLAEAFRVLKPGGRLAVSDVVVEGELPEAVRKDMELYVGCVAGALERDDYLAKLRSAGFVEESIEPTRRYQFSAIEGSWAPKGIGALSEAEKAALDGKIMGAFIRARKPS